VITRNEILLRAMVPGLGGISDGVDDALQQCRLLAAKLGEHDDDVAVALRMALPIEMLELVLGRVAVLRDLIEPDADFNE
jgi:hypothetical protein